ncbi:hypothetical protein GDO81_021421 [Engystomops pustulosus]|uniref:Uncharacterized protein n=1 Tax=Engystomops pustulosus TaxID=76066 RepID=A0AAV6ZNX8_ENGPU|nr:hypothetical protein GDO81_021421 [Engystomops pustulosus]
MAAFKRMEREKNPFFLWIKTLNCRQCAVHTGWGLQLEALFCPDPGEMETLRCSVGKGGKEKPALYQTGTIQDLENDKTSSLLRHSGETATLQQEQQ